MSSTYILARLTFFLCFFGVVAADAVYGYGIGGGVGGLVSSIWILPIIDFIHSRLDHLDSRYLCYCQYSSIIS